MEFGIAQMQVWDIASNQSDVSLLEIRNTFTDKLFTFSLSKQHYLKLHMLMQGKDKMRVRHMAAHCSLLMNDFTF